MFVLTGVLESMERDDAKTLIERYGGKVTGNISKKTTYLVQGRDSGVSKLEKVNHPSFTLTNPGQYTIFMSFKCDCVARAKFFYKTTA